MPKAFQRRALSEFHWLALLFWDQNIRRAAQSPLFPEIASPPLWSKKRNFRLPDHHKPFDQAKTPANGLHPYHYEFHNTDRAQIPHRMLKRVQPQKVK